MKELTFKFIIEHPDLEYSKTEVRNAYEKSLFKYYSIDDYIKHIDQYEYPIRDLNCHSKNDRLYLEECFDKIENGICNLFFMKINKDTANGEFTGYGFSVIKSKIKIKPE